MQQIKVFVNDTFQFDLKVPQDKDMGDLSITLAETMKVNMKSAQIGPGRINVRTF